MTAPEFFSKQWAEAVGDALIAGPSEQVRASKLREYWDFFEMIKGGCQASWALGCRDLPVGPGGRSGSVGWASTAGAPAYLFAQWGGGAVTDCRIIGPDSPLEATYVLGMDYADWKALHEGYDAQRTVMYRKILLEDGDLLEFFKSIYFFVESLALIGAVPAAYPEALYAGPSAELPGDGCRALRSVTELSNVPPPIADEAPCHAHPGRRCREA